MFVGDYLNCSFQSVVQYMFLVVGETGAAGRNLQISTCFVKQGHRHIGNAFNNMFLFNEAEIIAMV